MGVGSPGNRRNRWQKRPTGHCGGGSVPAFAAGGPIWIGGAARAGWARAGGPARAGGRLFGPAPAPAAGAGPGWAARALGALGLVVAGGEEAARGKNDPPPT